MSRPRYPALFQVNTRVRLSELAAALGRPATLDDITDVELDRLAADGFDIVWFLGVWQTGDAARRVSKSNPEWLAEYHRVLPDFREDDVCGSCFAIRDYRVHEDFGGDEALARLRQRLQRRGLRLVLDFVPNHMAPDHGWVSEHPDFFVTGTEEQLAAAPRNYCRVETGHGTRILAYGRDPYFDGWPDTLQLNYGNPALQEAMLGELERIAHQCDGVRCDMAMLVLPEVFERTWGIAAPAFWPRVTDAVRAKVPEFLFLAEVYWDLEWTLQQQGFDYTYDKRLYDRLERRPRPSGPRAPLCGPRLPEPPGPLPRKPRRAPGRRDLHARHTPGRRRHHVPHAWPPLHPPGPARGQACAHSRSTSAGGRSKCSKAGFPPFTTAS